MAIDPRYNHPYWFNAGSGERRWTRPVDPAAAAAASAASGDLPEGWQEAVDPATGVKYYFNRSLNTQQWERPAGQPRAANTAAGGAPAPEYDACGQFGGARAGCAFKLGPQGLGYYRCASSVAMGGAASSVSMGGAASSVSVTCAAAER